MSDVNPIIEKIRKLLALAGSSNEHESALALARAQELMAKHQIEAKDVKIDKFTTQKKNFVREPYAMRFVNSIVQKYFFVRIIFGSFNGANFIGKPLDVQLSIYIHAFLIRVFNRLWSINKKQLLGRVRSTKRKREIKWSYFRGISASVMYKLELSRMRIEQEYGIIQTSEKLNEYCKAEFDLTTIQYRTQRLVTDAAAAGIIDGDKIDIRKPMQQANQDKKQLAAG